MILKIEVELKSRRWLTNRFTFLSNLIERFDLFFQVISNPLKPLDYSCRPKFLDLIRNLLLMGRLPLVTQQFIA